MDILFTGGAGDVFALESIMTDDEVESLDRIYWATAVGGMMAPLFRSSPHFKHAQHIVLPSGETTYFNATGVRRDFPTLPEVDDWSIEVRFKEWSSREFHGSRLLGQPRCRLAVPDHYILVQDSTPRNDAASRALRDLDASEWRCLITRLERENRHAVVVNSKDGPKPPHHPRVIDLVGKTTYDQSIDLLTRADGFWGIASSLCVLASQLFDAEQLWVKGPETWLWINRYIYFAPHQTFPFLFDRLDHEKPKPAVYKGMTDKQVEMLKMRLLNGDLVGPGSIVDVSPQVADTLIRSGQAKPYEEPKRAVMKPVKHRATKIQAQRKTECE